MIVSKKHYDYLRNKFDLLTNELVKANSDLSNNINFVSYMKPQDVQDILWGEAEKIQYEDIVKALVKTIKFYEQANHKLDRAVYYALSDCTKYLKDNLIFKSHLRDFILRGMDHSEATKAALIFTILDINKTVNILQDLNTTLILEKDELQEQNERYETDNKNLCETAERLNKENDALENEVHELSALYNTKVDEIKQLRKDIEYHERKNNKLTDANLKQFSTIQERNNEIDALKHMLDRKEND